MSDLVERLRNRIHDSPMPAEHLMDEAEEEIERLRAVLEETLVTMRHATVFLHTRERIHQDGFALWLDNIKAIEGTLALPPSERETP